MDYKLGQMLYRVYQDSMIIYRISDMTMSSNKVGIYRVGNLGYFYLSVDYLKQHFFTSEKAAWQEHRKNLAIQIESDKKRLQELHSKMNNTINMLVAIDSIISGLNS